MPLRGQDEVNAALGPVLRLIIIVLRPTAPPSLVGFSDLAQTIEHGLALIH